jgi:S-DNA-T family DNA segregation ATPase FtsK/SpoIIIE
MYRKLNLTADRIEAVLRERHASATVVGGRVLPGFVEMLLRPEAGTKVSQVKALQADIALAVGSNNVRIAQSGSSLSIQIGRERRQPVKLARLMEQLANLPSYSAVLGLAEDGAPLVARLPSPDVTHVLIAGTTGSGKTSLAQTFLCSLCQQHRPRELGVVIVDPKYRPDDVFSRTVSRHLLLEPARATEDAMSALARILDVMDTRSNQLAPLPRVIVYIDELTDLCMSGGAEMVERITRIAQRGREPGIHLLLCTQKPSAKAIGSLLKANLPLRLIGRVMSAEDSRNAAGVAGVGAERLGGSGDFIAVYAGRAIRFQAALPS